MNNELAIALFQFFEGQEKVEYCFGHYLMVANRMNSNDDGKSSKRDPALDTVDGKRTQLAVNPNARSSSTSINDDFDTIPDITFEEVLPTKGEYLGKYRVDGEVARGGMGVVLRCKDTRLKREVAVKILSSHHVNNAHLKRRFLHEARIMSQLQHPGIIPVFDIGNWKNNRPFFAMELISGKTLESLIKNSTESVEKGRLIKAFEQVCQTLAFVHASGIVHLDLKPGNVLIGNHGQVYLMDWGLAKILRQSMQGEFENRKGAKGNDDNTELHNGSESKQVANRISGTPAYLSPEQARGEIVDTRTDVFCLGGMLCEILTGQPPYIGNDLRRLFVRAANAELQATFERLDRCGEDAMLIRLAKSCLSVDPHDRPRDAIQVALQIAAFLETALRDAQADLTRFFDLSLDLFCIASFDGYFLRVNSNFSRVLGYPSSELVSKAFMEFVHPDDRQPTVDAMGALMTGNPVIRFRNRYRNVAGDYVCFEWTAKSITNEKIVFAVAREIPDGWPQTPIIVT